MAIQPIHAHSVRKITSGQVITDLQSAVKELVENALDAGATTIEIRLKDHGQRGFEVIDNGSGIAQEDYVGIGLKHYTSKLESFEDLTKVTTYGFRGEAISSLCALSEKVSVLTATARDKVGTKLELDKNGVAQVIGKAPRKTGTTIRVTGLFATLPVRQKDFKKNATSQYAKTLNFLNFYALCRFNVAFFVYNELENKKTLQFSTQATTDQSYTTNYLSIFGSKALKTMVELKDVVFEYTNVPSIHQEDDTTSLVSVTVKGLISKPAPGFGLSRTDRQFFYINTRPIHGNKYAKVCNEVYKTFNTNQYPALMIDFRIPEHCIDINVSPDKRDIFLQSEGEFVEGFRVALERFLHPYRSSFLLNQPPLRKDSSSQLVINDPSMATSKHGTSEDDHSTDHVDQTLQQSSSRKRRRVTTPDLQRKKVILELDDDFVPESNPAIIAEVEASSHELDMVEEETEEGRKQNKRRGKQKPVELEENQGAEDVDTPISIAIKKAKSRQTVLSTSGTSWSLKLQSSQEQIDASKDLAKQKRRTNKGEISEPKDTIDVSHENIEVEPEKPVAFSDVQNDDLLNEAEIGDFDTVLDVRIASVDPEESLDSIKPYSKRDLFGSPSRHDTDLVRSSSVPTNPSLRRKSKETLSDSPSERYFRDEIDGTFGVDCSIDISFSKLAKTWKGVNFGNDFSVAMENIDNHDAKEAGVENDQDTAEKILSRIVDKRDFRHMEIIGQFNVGFILARRRTSRLSPRKSTKVEDHDDIFIIDQHAADEKYNFENLQKTTKIQSQRLIAAKPLALSTSDEVIAISNISRIRENGFDIKIDYDASVGHRISLLAMPISKDVVFDDKDLEELLSLLADRTGREVVRPSKVRKMFASRACRMSIMIGTTLQKGAMKKVITNMGTMDQPWSCPHGRPTMRWLVSMKDENSARYELDRLNRYESKSLGFRMLDWWRRTPTPSQETNTEC